MTARRWLAAAALALPVAVLAVKAAWHERARRVGTLVDVPVRGYDPRDLLAGQYLAFRLDFGPAGQCPEGVRGEALICLRPTRKLVRGERPPPGCELHLRGRCRYGVFQTGLERHFVPERRAALLEGLVRERRVALRLRVHPDGSASPVTLLVDGVPWKEYVRRNDPPAPAGRR